MTTQRFIIENNGADIANVRTLFENAAAFCLRRQIDLITLVVPVKSSFPDTVIADYLGTRIARNLSRGGRVSLVKGLELRVTISSQLPSLEDNGLTLAVYLAARDLALVDADPSVNNMAFLPWTKSEGLAWMALWEPQTWGPSNWSVTPMVLPDPVEQELARLTRLVNLGTGLAHPCDKESALRVFKGFRLSGYRLNAEHVKGWAIKHGWGAQHADDLAALSRKYCL